MGGGGIVGMMTSMLDDGNDGERSCSSENIMTVKP